MKQLKLESQTILEHRIKPITPANEYAFKKLYADMYAIGMIPKELYLKVQLKNYCKIKSYEVVDNHR